MKRSIAKDKEIARVILNLGHIYSNKDREDNIEDGQSPSNTSSSTPHSTTMVDRFPNSSAQNIQHHYRDIHCSNSLFNSSTDSSAIVSTSILSPPTNTGSHHFTHLSHNSNNTLPSCNCTHSPCHHMLSSSHLCLSSGGREGKCEPGHCLGTPMKESEKSEKVQMEFNKNIQYNIELEKQSQLYTETQHLNDKILKEFDTEEQQNHEAYMELKLDIQIQIDSENQQKLDENVQKKLGEKQQMTFEKDVKLILNIEMQQELDEKLLNHQINEEKQNMCKNYVQKILTNENINEKIQGQIDDQTCVVKQVVTCDSQNLSEFELEAQQIDEIEIEELNHKIQEDIKKLLTDVLNSRQIIDKQMKGILNGDPELEILNKKKQEFEELQREIAKIYSDNDVDLEREIIENIDKTYIYSTHVKFLENLIILLHQESVPFFGRIKQLCNLYFQEKFNTKLDLKEDEITQQESSENTRKVNAIQHFVNENTVPMVKERNIFNFFDKNGVEAGSLKTFEENNKAIQSNSKDSDIEIDDFEDNIQINSEVQEESEVEIEDFEDNAQINSEVQEESEVDIESFEDDVQVYSEAQKESDVEIEDFNDDIRVCSKVQGESEVEIEDLEDNIQYEYENNTEQFNETNETVEIIDEYEVKSTSSMDEFISTEDEYNFTGKEFSSDSDDEFNRTTQLQFLTQEFERVSKETIEGVTEQKHQEDELHKQLIDFQKELFTKLKYDEECKLRVNTNRNFVLSKFFDEQQQTFFKLKDEFHEIEQEYKGSIQQQVFKELKKTIDDKLLKEIKGFPEEFDDEQNIQINADIQNEYVDLQRSLRELEPEFLFNVPFQYEEDNPSQYSLQQKPYNLFKKLHFIHKQKLHELSNSNQWPEKYLYPSSLLDSLFEDPREVKPNVLLITLFSIDIGYSISIITKANEPPTVKFFSYAEDSILEYVECEKLPLDLLDMLDDAEPTLFYCGCVIAEIHDQINGVPGKLYRILLHPTHITILSDMQQIMAENSHVNWSYKKILKLESILLSTFRPTMCMDSLPIAGLTVKLQHQQLSLRKIQLNPLKMKYKSEH